MAMTRLSEHWQVDRSLIECNQHMLLNEEFSDVTFVLDYKDAAEKKESVHIPALQTLLLARSPVFAAMFTGDLAEKNRPVIHIDDVEPHSFKEMLRFIYTDDAHLNADNVMQIMYAAKKYIVTNLARKCSKFLEENLSADTAPQLLEQSIVFDERDLKDKVLTTIVDEAPAVLSSEDFTKLSKEALHEVLQLNLKITSEMEVFKACIKWAENKCQQLQKTMDGANLREVLGDNLCLIRFPTMTIDDINDIVAPRDILTDCEGYQLFRYLTTKSKPENLPFPIKPRHDSAPQSLLIPAAYAQLSNTLQYGGSWNILTSLKCSVSQSVKINRIFIHANADSRRKQHLIVNVVQNGKTLFSYAGKHAVTPMSEGTPTRFAVDGKSASVKAGVLQMDIQLMLTYSAACCIVPAYQTFTVQASVAVTKLSDHFVSIDFPPVDQNLLLGIEYVPM